MKKTVAVYLHEGLADWEAAFILPTLREAGYRVKTFAETPEAVGTLGGLKVLPETTLAAMGWDDVRLLILPGGESWSDKARNGAMLARLPQLHRDGIAVAGICAATVAMIRSGFLDGIRHTSNFPEMIPQLVPGYKADFYVTAPAVTDQNVITAAGHHPLEFSREIIRLLDIYDDKKTEEWVQFFKNGTVPETWIP